MALVLDFPSTEPVFAIIKHNNACGMAIRSTVKQAYLDALAGDPVSAFWRYLCCNTEIDEISANEIDKLFFEVIIAPSYSPKSLSILQSKKNRIILEMNDTDRPRKISRSILNGTLIQEKRISC